MREKTEAVPTPRTADVPPEVRVIHVDDDGGFLEMSSESYNGPTTGLKSERKPTLRR